MGQWCARFRNTAETPSCSDSLPSDGSRSGSPDRRRPANKAGEFNILSSFLVVTLFSSSHRTEIIYAGNDNI